MPNQENKLFLDDEMITLSDEFGEETVFAYIAEIYLNDVNYAVLTPVNDAAEEDDMGAVIFKVIKTNEEDYSYELVEDEEILNAVYDEYIKLEEAFEADPSAFGCDCDECDCEECNECDCEECDDNCEHEHKHSDDCDCGCGGKKNKK